MNLENHPTVKRLRQSSQNTASESDRAPSKIESCELLKLALDHGAHDAGLVDIARPALDPQRDEILRNYPWTKTLLSYVVRMAREPVRGAPRSVANLEFHRTAHDTNEIGAHIVAALEARGIRAVNPSMGFPMEMYHTPGYAPWVVSHKPIAIEAGLGHMGIHRNLIHPKFGNFVLLGTVLIETEADVYNRPIDYNPCLECKLCVAACPVGAIGPDGSFNFSSCFTHNYREFLGGFSDWVEQIADARDAIDYRRRINENETASMWQSLSYGANYKSAYCMAVCPAGEDVIGPYLDDKQRHLQEVVRPLQERPEPVYVVEGSDAAAVARRKFKSKTVKTVGNGLRPRSIAGLLYFMPFVFQPNQSRGLNAAFHFRFTGAEEREATITIRDRAIDIKDGLVGKADLRVTADAKAWLGFLAREKNLPLALASGKIRIKGDPRLLLAFGKCFPTAPARHARIEVPSTPSLLKHETTPYQRNDPATGKIRWRGKMVLAATEDVTHNVKTFCFSLPGGAPVPFDYLPGQFLTLHVAPEGVPVTRSYTIASSPTWRDRIEITVKREPHGLVSRWLHDFVAPGDEVEIEAPNGTFSFSGHEADRVLLIGGGVGLTPMMSTARYLTDIGWSGRLHLILGFRTPADVIFRKEIDDLQRRNPNLHVAIALSQPGEEAWTGLEGRIGAELLASVIPDIAACGRAHICGPPQMMEDVKSALGALGVPATAVRTEAFGTIKRDPTAKNGASMKVAGQAFFQASEVTAGVFEGATILDAADGAGVFIDNACRSGTCGSCRVKLVAGAVRMPVEDALTDEDKVDGYILACQAEIGEDVVIDA
jgi:ferredoxin-NADP reductase/Fe-S-cluster-containing hydrogenase component 2